MNSQINDLLYRLLDETPNAFGVFDSNNQLLYCNANMANVFGLSRQQATGLTHRELMRNAYNNGLGVRTDSEDFEQWVSDVESRQRLDPVRTFESDLFNGEWLKITQVTIDDHLVLIGTNITELKDTEARLRTALEELNDVANTDVLTSVANRRHFFARAGEELARAQRYQHPLCLMLLDIDYFKQVNDQFGHHAGDQVLQFFARFYESGLRKIDFFARLGGEEFVVLLPETRLPDAMNLGNRLREQLTQQSIYTMPEEQQLRITVSAGISQFEGSGDSVQTLLSRADEALYRAKAHGRNCCEAAAPWPAVG